MEKQENNSNSAEKLAKENKVLQEENIVKEDMKNENISEQSKTSSDKKPKKKFFGKDKDTKNRKIFGQSESDSDRKIKQLEEQNTELKTEALRARADFENYRKRMQKELAEARERAITSFVIDILPSIDNFEMSLKMTDNKDMFIKGVEMIHNNLLNTLKENHYEQFNPEIGEEFNPHFHEPILIETDEYEPGKIINVLQIGYKKEENIIRPARVQIAKLPEKEEGSTN